jgi:hypothetical protein
LTLGTSQNSTDLKLKEVVIESLSWQSCFLTRKFKTSFKKPTPLKFKNKERLNATLRKLHNMQNLVEGFILVKAPFG